MRSVSITHTQSMLIFYTKDSLQSTEYLSL